jgi:hypothetical protein
MARLRELLNAINVKYPSTVIRPGHTRPRELGAEQRKVISSNTLAGEIAIAKTFRKVRCQLFESRNDLELQTIFSRMSLLWLKTFLALGECLIADPVDLCHRLRYRDLRVDKSPPLSQQSICVELLKSEFDNPTQ